MSVNADDDELKKRVEDDAARHIEEDQLFFDGIKKSVESIADEDRRLRTLNDLKETYEYAIARGREKSVKASGKSVRSIEKENSKLNQSNIDLTALESLPANSENRAEKIEEKRKEIANLQINIKYHNRQIEDAKTHYALFDKINTKASLTPTAETIRDLKTQTIRINIAVKKQRGLLTTLKKNEKAAGKAFESLTEKATHERRMEDSKADYEFSRKIFDTIAANNKEDVEPTRELRTQFKCLASAIEKRDDYRAKLEIAEKNPQKLSEEQALRRVANTKKDYEVANNFLKTAQEKGDTKNLPNQFKLMKPAVAARNEITKQLEKEESRQLEKKNEIREAEIKVIQLKRLHEIETEKLDDMKVTTNTQISAAIAQQDVVYKSKSALRLQELKLQTLKETQAKNEPSDVERLKKAQDNEVQANLLLQTIVDLIAQNADPKEIKNAQKELTLLKERIKKGEDSAPTPTQNQNPNPTPPATIQTPTLTSTAPRPPGTPLPRLKPRPSQNNISVPMHTSEIARAQAKLKVAELTNYEIRPHAHTKGQPIKEGEFALFDKNPTSTIPACYIKFELDQNGQGMMTADAFAKTIDNNAINAIAILSARSQPKNFMGCSPTPSGAHFNLTEDQKNPGLNTSAKEAFQHTYETVYKEERMKMIGEAISQNNTALENGRRVSEPLPSDKQNAGTSQRKNTA